MAEITGGCGARPQRKHAAVLRQWLKPAGARIADIGCGQGGTARLLARDGACVVGLDPQDAVLRRARGDAGARPGAAPGDPPPGDTAYVAARGEALPLATACLDAAVCFNALHHVPVARQDAALAEIHRVLAVGARLVVVEPIAEGAIFEMVQPVEDETAVRAAADAALRRAGAKSGWRLLHQSDYDAAVRYESFQAFRESVVAADPAREAAVARHEASMHRRFAAAAREAEGVFWLDQPCRLTVLETAAPTGVD